jgi:putative nucleotidyltransferase with HDIG domain
MSEMAGEPALNPSTVEAARALLVELGAAPRLLRHVELVAEAAELLLAKLGELGVPLRIDLVRIGALLHDAGKVVHPGELERSGHEHQPAGQALLLQRGASPELARICMTHARWNQMPVSLEELVVAVADKIWKGVRKHELEELFVARVAKALGKERWDLDLELDGLLEQIAADGPSRLERSRV